MEVKWKFHTLSTSENTKHLQFPLCVQLPEPMILYRYYNDFIGLAKECQRVIVEEANKPQSPQTEEKGGPSVQLKRVIFKIRDSLRQLPTANYRTLRFLIAHLNR